MDGHWPPPRRLSAGAVRFTIQPKTLSVGSGLPPPRGQPGRAEAQQGQRPRLRDRCEHQGMKRATLKGAAGGDHTGVVDAGSAPDGPAGWDQIAKASHLSVVEKRDVDYVPGDVRLADDNTVVVDATWAADCSTEGAKVLKCEWLSVLARTEGMRA